MAVQIDFVNDPTSVTETWTDVTAYARIEGDNPILTTTRGRDYELARTATGTFDLVLDNTDGRFDPSNGASPYVTGTGNPGGATGLIVPGRRIRVQATWLGITYNVFRGFVDSWPQAWTAAGFYGRANTVGTDGFAALAGVILPSLYVQAVLADAPAALYRCDDAGVSAGNSSTIPQPSSRIIASAGTTTDSYAFGSDAGAGNLAGDPTSSLKLSPLAVPAFGNDPTGYLLRTADLGVGPIIGTGTLLGAPGFSIEAWFKTSLAAANPGVLFTQYDKTGAWQVIVNTVTNGVLQFALADVNNTNRPALTSAVGVSDGAWHHAVCTLAADGRTPRMILDGVDQTAAVGATVVTPAGAAAWYPSMGNQWGAFGPTGSAFLDCNLKNLALYNYPLSLAQAQKHFLAGQGFPGDSTGVRQGRILDAAGWPSALRTLATGSSTHGTSSTETTKALEALQSVNDTEQGTIFQAPNGNIVQTDRAARWNLTSVSTLGEHVAELHYLGDIVVAMDSRDVYNDVTVARTDGVTVRDQDTASQIRYFPRSLQITSTANTDADAVYLAQWLLTTYRNPALRVPSLSLDPVTQPALWPIVLGYDIGTQVKVTRRPGKAPAISADFFVEKITHTIAPSTWTVSWLLSPASVDQVQQTDSATYGRVGGGTNLGSAATSGAASISAVSSTGNAYSTTDTPYNLVIDAEQMTVTAAGALSGGAQTLTVTRGVAGTAAAAHLIGAAINVVALPITY